MFKDPVRAWPQLVDDMHALLQDDIMFQRAFDAADGSIAAPTPMKLFKKQQPWTSTERKRNKTTDESEQSANTGKAGQHKTSRCSDAGQKPAKAGAKAGVKKKAEVKRKK